MKDNSSNNNIKFSKDQKYLLDTEEPLAEALKMEPLEIDRLEACALLHDIGMIGVSDEIRNKPGELTGRELEEYKSHTRLGATIVSHVPQLVPCAPGILYHRERYDGGGYPEGLKGEAIPLEARILARAQAFAAMTSEGSCSDTLPYESALEEIKRGAGKQFDPHLVENFLSIYGKRFAMTTKKNMRR